MCLSSKVAEGAQTATVAQEKCRLPVRDAVNLLGVLDESGELREGQIYFSWTPQLPDGSIGRARTLPTGTRVAVSRPPCLSSQDIRLLTVADPAQLPPALTQLVNVVAFSQRGARPAPSLMSGGDLDGDLYFIIWDTQLVPASAHAPLDYSPSTQPVEVVGAARARCHVSQAVRSALSCMRLRNNEQLMHITSALFVVHAQMLLQTAKLAAASLSARVQAR